MFGNYQTPRYLFYQSTKNKFFNDNILSLSYKNLDKWEHRNSLQSNLERRYNSTILFKEIFLDMNHESRNFNLKYNADKHEINIFTDLKLYLSKLLNINDYFIIFTIYKDDKIFIRLSTLGIIAMFGYIECTEENELWNVYKIPLFSMFEKHYWNINDIDTDNSNINIELTYKKRNILSSNILPNNLMLSCKAANVNNWKIIESNSKHNKVIINTNYDEFIMTEKIIMNEIDNTCTEFDFIKGLTPMFYIATYENNAYNRNINIDSINIDNFIIKNNTTRIVNDNIHNIVSCWLFPDNTNNLIKKEKVFGYNFAVNNSKIIVNFNEIPNKILIGYFQFRLLIYKNNNCRSI